MSLSYADLIIQEFTKLLQEKIDSNLDIMELGSSSVISDYAAYREHVGRLYAYRMAFELLGVAEDNVKKAS